MVKKTIKTITSNCIKETRDPPILNHFRISHDISAGTAVSCLKQIPLVPRAEDLNTKPKTHEVNLIILLIVIF